MNKATEKWIDWVLHTSEIHKNATDVQIIVAEEQNTSIKPKPQPIKHTRKRAEWNIPIPRSHNEKQTALDEMNKRHANAQNLFTGEPLEGQDLKDWELLERQRDYSLETK